MDFVHACDARMLTSERLGQDDLEAFAGWLGCYHTRHVGYVFRVKCRRIVRWRIWKAVKSRWINVACMCTTPRSKCDELKFCSNV